MTDPSEYSTIGEDFVLDEQEQQATLSNEQVEAIQRQLEVPEVTPVDRVQQDTQPATAAKPAPVETESQPTGEQPKQEKGFLKGLHYFGTPLDQHYTGMAERMSAPGMGIIDTAVDGINFLLQKTGLQIPKATKYEDEVAQATRTISSVVLPTLLTQGAYSSVAARAQAAAVTKLGPANKINQLGNTAFMKFVGNRGVESAAALTVGAVTTEYETGDNLSGMLKKSFPKTYDFIPDSWATLDGEAPDKKRQKNINEDLALGF